MADSLEIEGVVKLGGLPAIQHFCQRLDLARLIDEKLPIAPQGLLSHGTVFIALVMNKLHSATPLYLVEQWADETAVCQLLKLKPEQLNDDRLGRTLEAIADNADSLKASICHKAIREFGLDVGRLHWDLTSLSFCGEYEDQDPDFADVTFGYSYQGVGEKKQIRFGNLTCGDGAIGGLYHETYSGNQSDQNTIGEHLHLLRRLAENSNAPVLVVGDSKLASPETMVDFEEAGIRFLYPEPANRDVKATLANYAQFDLEEWTELDYESQRDQRNQNRESPIYKAQETTMLVEIVEAQDKEYSAGSQLTPSKSGPKGGRPRKCRRRYQFRRIVVFSPPRQLAARKNRARRLGKLEDQLNELTQKFQGQWWRRQKRERAVAAVEKLLSSSKWGRLYSYELSSSESGWEMSFDLDKSALEQSEKVDGLYTLVTNIPLEESDASEVFRSYKRQNDAERRFADWKVPTHVSSCFLKNNKRIVGMVFVLTIALLILCLLERHVRAQLPNGEMVGLLPVKRPMKATGWNILRRLDAMTLIGLRINDNLSWKPSRADPVQENLLKLIRADIVISN